MAISSPGIGSNLDVNSIVSQLMVVESQPLVALTKKETSYQAKLSGFGTLKGALSQFQSAVNGLSDLSKFQVLRSSVSDTSIATISATSSAPPGNYALEVSKLAQTQKLAAPGQASASTAIGTGVISFDFGSISGGSFNSGTGKYTGAGFTSNGAGIKTVTIDSSNNSLTGIRDAINKANIGISASIVNDGDATKPYRLALSSATTGKNNSVKISLDAAGALSDLLSHDPAGSQALSETQTAQNAEFKIDGIAISKASNTVSDAITGVTLNLLKTNSGSPTNISVARDSTAVQTAVNGFVKSFNDISQTLRDAAAYNPNTKAAASLNGEATVRSISTQIRTILAAPVAGGASTFSLLSSIGISMQKDGLMSVSSTKLQAAMDSNFNDVAGLFAATGKSSDSLVAYSAAGSKTIPGAYAVNISQLATQGNSVATVAPTSLDIVTGVNDSLQVQLDGTTATITLSQNTYTAATLAAEIQSKINGVASFTSAGSSVTVSESGGKLSVSSNRYGSASNASITGGNGQANLGFDILSNPGINAGLDIAGTLNGVAATGSGQTLTGATADPSEGIALKITGGATGNRGMVNYSQGYAYQFNQLATKLLASDGPISSRTNGINTSLKSITKDRNNISAKLTATEKRYRAQFTALDLAMSSMTKTSSFLTQQLANLPKSA